MHMLCCDWLLSTRADVWEKERLESEQHSSEGSSRLDGFNKDLRSLQKVASYIPDAMPKVCETHLLILLSCSIVILFATIFRSLNICFRRIHYDVIIRTTNQI